MLPKYHEDSVPGSEGRISSETFELTAVVNIPVAESKAHQQTLIGQTTLPQLDTSRNFKSYICLRSHSVWIYINAVSVWMDLDRPVCRMRGQPWQRTSGRVSE